MEKQTRILVVEDEETLCEALSFNLEAEGYVVDTVFSAEEALTKDMSDYNLILLDIMLGEISGVQLAGILKSNPSTKAIPIIFCTAKDSEDDVIAGLDLGADDYISKPYSLRTLLARVRTVLRRTENNSTDKIAAESDDDRISYEGLVIYPSRKCCTVNGEEVRMPKKEFELLCMMMRKPGRIFSREELLREIWTDEVIVIDRVVDVNITRIRRKIGNYGKCIVTRSGYGYGFMVD